MLKQFLQMFANLWTDRGRGRYHEITYHRAPHKPFLLLSVIDLIAQGRITQNLIEFSCELGFGSDRDNNLKSRRKNRRAAPSKGLKLHFQHKEESSRTKTWENWELRLGRNTRMDMQSLLLLCYSHYA
jgi:predicted restriction endonuclease